MARVVVPKSYRPKEQPRNTRNEFPIRGDFGNSLDYEQPLFFVSASSQNALDTQMTQKTESSNKKYSCMHFEGKEKC